MRTEALVKKYAALLAPKLHCDPAVLAFQVREPGGEWVVVGNLDYDKTEDKEHFHDWCLGTYRVMWHDELVSSFELYQMPHCCGIMVSCRAFVDPKWRNRGVGTILNNLRQEIGRMLGYSVMLCTDVTTNEHQRKLLKTNGFRDIHSFVNQRTHNQVYICVVGL